MSSRVLLRFANSLVKNSFVSTSPGARCCFFGADYKAASMLKMFRCFTPAELSLEMPQIQTGVFSALEKLKLL